jgi:hypothetical protein
LIRAVVSSIGRDIVCKITGGGSIIRPPDTKVAVYIKTGEENHIQYLARTSLVSAGRVIPECENITRLDIQERVICGSTRRV